jgi:hypothetical protein
MKIAPFLIIQDPKLLPELRDLLTEYPWLTRRGPEAVRHALRRLRTIEADVFAVEAALEALEIEGEVLP